MLRRCSKYFFAGGLLCLLFSKGEAQIAVASLFQAPLLIHPGLAGNTGKHRVAVLANRNDYYVPVVKEPASDLELNKSLSMRSVYTGTSNYYASYDQMWKGYGIGGFMTYTHTPSQTNTNEVLRQGFGQFLDNEYTLGAVISPKLKVPHPILTDRVKYTIAPSLMLSYKGGTQNSILHIPIENDYAFTSTDYEKKFSLHQLQTQVGLVINSARGYLGYNLGFVYDFTDESKVVRRDTLNQDKSSRLHFLALQHSACMGLIFPKKEGSRFSFSPITSLGFSNSLAGGNKSESLYLSYMQNGLNWLGYVHQSLNFRYQWALFGVAYTEWQNQRIAAYHVGFKNKYARCTLFYSFWDKSPAKLEASMTILFN